MRKQRPQEVMKAGSVSKRNDTDEKKDEYAEGENEREPEREEADLARKIAK